MLTLRNMPVHDDLLKIGFLKYVEERKKDGEDALLFSDLKRNARNKYAPVVSNWFGRYTKSIGIKNNKKSFHSFRDHFNDAAEDAELSDRQIMRLMGQALDGSKKHYGNGAATRKLHESINRISFYGLDLSHLYVDDKSTQEMVIPSVQEAKAK
jgi:hypothetical protein